MRSHLAEITTYLAHNGIVCPLAAQCGLQICCPPTPQYSSDVTHSAVVNCELMDQSNCTSKFAWNWLKTWCSHNVLPLFRTTQT